MERMEQIQESIRQKQQDVAIDERQRTRGRKEPKTAQSLRPWEQVGW